MADIERQCGVLNDGKLPREASGHEVGNHSERRVTMRFFVTVK